MRRLWISFGIITIILLGLGVVPVQGQTGIQYTWRPPLNNGEMPTNRPLLPAAVSMPVLPLTEALIPGTLFFNIESYAEEYSIMNVTLDGLDDRFYAYNITYRYGIHPVSPNGQYGIYTVPDGSTSVITCAILDMITMETVDRFETTGGCNQSNIKWSPDSTKILYQSVDEEGRPALAIRRDAQTAIIRPTPSTSADIGAENIDNTSFYIPRGWVNANLFYFEIGTGGSISETLYANLSNPTLAVPATSLLFEDTLARLILSRPAQRVGEIRRTLMLTDIVTGDHFSIAPAGHQARIGTVSPNGDAIAYWAETESPRGTTHPLRLAIYYPDTDEQVVLLSFDGPTSSFLATRPGVLVWNPEGIYFHIEQQPEANSALQTGTYRIQPDGSNLEFVTAELLWSALPTR